MEIFEALSNSNIIADMMMMAITIILGVVAKKANTYANNKIELEKYNFDKDRVERIIENGVRFAEQKAKEFVSSKFGSTTKSETKLENAMIYILSEDSKITNVENKVHRMLNKLDI